MSLIVGRFLQITDSEVDNQPVKLQTMPLTQIDEESMSSKI